MNSYLLVLSLILGFAVVNAWFCERRVTISRTGDIFILAWFYYGFSVGLDRFLGLEIYGIPGMTDFSEADVQPLLLKATGYYLVCGVAFFCAYSFSGASSAPERLEPKPIRLPPLSALLAMHLVVLVLVYRSDYLDFSRAQRMLMVRESGLFRATMLSISCVRALDYVYLIYAHDRTRVGVVAACAVLVGLLAGGRLEIATVVLVLALRKQCSVSRRTFVVGLGMCLIALASWKSVYHYCYDRLTANSLDRGAMEFMDTSLSDVESYASMLVFTTVLDSECPWYLGSTYLRDTVEATIPHEFRDIGFMTLSQEFAWSYTSDRAEAGIGTGYSALAESWLNFGPWGPVLLGLIVGWLAKRVDTGPRGIVFFVFAFVMFRLFRTEFAALWKSWVVIYGGSMGFTYFCCKALLTRSQRAPDTRRISPSVLPRPSEAAS